MYAQRANDVLPIIDTLLKNKLPISIKLHIKAIKLEALVHIEKFETALIFSNQLLKNKNLKGISLMRTRMERALLFGMTNQLTQMMKELNIVKDYYENPKIIKDELYGEYLFRSASWHQVQRLYDKALIYSEKAIIFGKTKDYANVEATGLILTAAMKYKPNSKEYIEYRKKALKLWKKSGNFYGMSWIYRDFSQYYNNNRQLNKALKYIDSSLNSAEKAQHYRGLSRGYKIMSQLYENKEDKDKALKYYKLFKQASDSSAHQIESRKVEEIQSKYNYNKEILKNKSLEQNLVIEKKEKKFLILGFIILISLLGGLVFLTMNLARKRREIKSQSLAIKNKNIALTDALEQNKLLLKELNHRVNNNLALILSLVKFQYYEIDEPKYKDKFQSLEHRIKTIAAAHEQLLYNKENVEGENYDVQEYLSKITNALIEISTKNIQLNLDAKNINLNIDTMLPIGILINELMSNSLKHAIINDKLIIDFKITLQKSNISIIYKDSGTTFIEKTNTKSLGISIINSMVKQLKGTLKRVNSEYNIMLQLKNSKNGND